MNAQLANPNAPGSLVGTVVDPVGAVVPQASVKVSRDGDSPIVVTTDGLGRYSIAKLKPGTYSVEAQAPGFSTLRQDNVHVGAGAVQRLTLTLQIEADQQQVVVSGNTVDSSPDKNGDAIVLKGSDLRALSDDPDELQEQLQAIAGSDAETGSQMYVDGFSGGKMPPKSAIREIRINQNPYSAQYDEMGFGRIEIFTKPGADKLHGDFWMQGNNSPWNARSPFVTEQPPYHSESYDGDANGPFNKVASWFASYYGQNAINDAIVNAIILDPSLNQVPFTQAISNPTNEINFSPRFDLQLGKVQTLTLRYELSRTSQTNAGVGQFELASQGYNSTNTEQVLQFSDTQAYGAKILNETRFQYIRDRNNQTPVSNEPTLAVQGGFTGGGNNIGINRDNQDHYEFQDYLHIDIGKHDVSVGARLRALRDSNYATANFNGQFTFATLAAYQITEQGLQNGLSPAAIRAAGGGASLFSQTRGTPSIAVTLIDTGLFAEDNWKVKPAVTFSYGLRFESQTDIHDRADFAPRLAVSWAIPGGKNKPPRAVIRAGTGMFYTRFQSTNVLQARRQNGVMQTDAVINAPDFYPSTCSSDPAACAGAQNNSPTIYQISPTLRASYLSVAGIGVDKPLGKIGNVTVNYMYSQGQHLYLTRNINAPLPGTYNPADPASGVRPLGTDQNIYQYESEGLSNRQRLMVNANIHSKHTGFFGYYMFGKVDTNTSGPGTFASNQYDLHSDYGRASYDVRNRGFFGGYARLPYKFSINPFLIYRSSSPFNIVVGQDLNGDTQFNDRPAFATDLTRPSVYQTKWGNFDADPIPGQTIIPINYGKGPGVIIANLRLSHSFNFGPVLPEEPAPAAAGAKGGKAAPGAPVKVPAKPEKKEIQRKYTWDLGIGAQNFLNHPNLAQPVGVLGSPLFGKSTALTSVFGSGSTGRAIFLQTFFRF